MIDFLYRHFFVKMTHDEKMKWADFFWRIPLFRNVLREKFDYNNDAEEERKLTKADYYAFAQNSSPILAERDNELETFFFEKDHRYVSKHLRYFDVYNRFFNGYRDREGLVVVEVGVFRGGSLQMWKDYFGRGSKIIGIDIDPRCKEYEEEGIEVCIGSQEDRDFWIKFKKEHPRVDIFIDDGGHTMNQQIVTFEEMYDHVAEDGVYVCEDCATSYWPSMGGQYRYRGSFIEFSKNCIDSIHARYSHTRKLKSDRITYSLYGIHFFDQMVVFEKNRRASIENEVIGYGKN